MQNLSDMIMKISKMTSDAVRVSLPATVVSFDSGKAVVSIDIDDDEPGEIEIGNVPVIFPSSKTFGIFFNIEPGSKGMLVFSDVNLDSWIDTGESSSPKTKRRHNINDACFYPGVVTSSKFVYSGEGVFIGKKDGSNGIEINNGVIVNSGTERLVTASELQSIINSLISILNTHTHTYAEGVVGAPVVPFENVEVNGTDKVMVP